MKTDDDERDLDPFPFTAIGVAALAILEKLIPVTEANCVTDHDTQHAGCRGYGETESEDEKSVGEGHVQSHPWRYDALSPEWRSASLIFTRSNRFEMVGIYAAPIATEVINLEPIWNLAARGFVAGAVCILVDHFSRPTAAVLIELAVAAVVDPTDPEPATAIRLRHHERMINVDFESDALTRNPIGLSECFGPGVSALLAQPPANAAHPNAAAIAVSIFS